MQKVLLLAIFLRIGLLFVIIEYDLISTSLGDICGTITCKIKGGMAMIRLYRLNNLSIIIMLSLFIFSCSQLGIQSKKETPEPSTIPECKKNYTKPGIWPFN